MNNIIDFMTNPNATTTELSKEEPTTMNMFTTNPFEESFLKSPLNFEIETSEIYTELSGKPCDDKKAVHKLDENNNSVDWWVVGKDYYDKTHKEFFGSIEQELLSNIQPGHLQGVQVRTKVSRNGRWGMRDYVFPNVNIPVETANGHNTTIQMRISAWNGLDGLTANNYILGAFDSFCTNGCVFTQAVDKENAYIKKWKRNSKNFSMDAFSADLSTAIEFFYEQSEEYQFMADKSLSVADGLEFIENIKSFSKAKQESMKELFIREVTNRGPNVFSLHSAFTNYSSHRNDDLFRTRKTKRDDVEAEILFKREEEITNIFQSNQWQDLLAA